MADFLLSVGVDIELSYDQMQKDISNLVSRLNSNPPKLRVDLEFDTAAITNLRTEISDLYQAVNSSGRTSGGGGGGGRGGFRRATQQAREHTIALRTVIDMYTQMHSLMGSNTNATGTATWDSLSTHAQQFATVLELVQSREITVNEALHQLGINGADFIENARVAMSAFRAEVEHTGTSGSINMNQMYIIVSQMQTLLNNNAGAAGLTTYIELQNRVTLFANAIRLVTTEHISLESALERVGLSGSTAIEEAKVAMSAFRAEVSGATFEEETLVTGTNEYYSALRQVNTLLGQVTHSQERWTAAQSGSSSAAYRDLGMYADELRTLEQQLRSGAITATDFRNRLAQIRAGVTTATNTIKAAGEATQTWGQRIGTLSAKFGTWFSITRVIMAAYRAVRQMVTNVIELDTAMTELKKVTNETDATYEKFLVRATSRAKELGAALSDTVSATADFARLGYGIEDAEKLADAAIVYKNVGDGIEDIGTASESIIATMQAFSIPPEQVMSIVDRFNEVGNNFAISSKGVGDALLRSAAALHSANNTLDESIALAAAANTIVQDPDKVGTALKTVSMYLRAAKTDAEEAGESTDGMANSISELREELLALTGNKVDIQLDENTFKSTYQILKELSVVWGELSDVSQSNILEMVGGKRNSNVVSALLEDFSVAEKAIKTSANSAGSALEENEKVLESVQGKINIMKATFETLSQNLIGSDIVKLVIDMGTGLMELINGVLRVVDALGGLKTVLLTLSAVLLISKGGLIAYKATLLGIAAVQKIITFFNGIRTAISTIINIIPNAIVAWKSYAAGVVSANTAMQASIPIIGLVLAAISAVVAGIALFSGSSKDIEKLNSEWESLSNTIESASNKFKSLRDEADDIIPKYAQLAQGVNRYGENIGLTDKEYAEFLELNNKIAEMFPELNLGMDSDGNAMLALSYSADTLSNSLWNLVEAQRKAANKEIADTMPDILTNITGSTQAYQTDLSKKKKILKEWAEFAESTRDSIYKSGKQIENRFVAEDAFIMAESIGVAREKIQDLIEFVEDDKHSGHYNWDKLLDSDAVKNAIAGIEKEIDNFEKNISAKWKKLNPVINAWMQTDFQYQDLSNEMQQVINNVVSGIDYQTLGLETEEDIKNYITDNIIAPIHDAAPEAQNALSATFSLKGLLDSNEISVGEYTATIDKVLEDIKKAGLNDETISIIKLSLDIEEVENMEKKLKEVLAPLTTFGNINVADRQSIEWTEENLNKYRDIIGDLGLSTDELKDSTSNLLGMWENYGGIDIAFSPMLQTENGAVLLSSDTIDTYINSLLSTLKDTKQEWTTEDLIQLDAEGLVIDGRRISGLIAEVGDNAEAASIKMHEMAVELQSIVGFNGEINLNYNDLKIAFRIIQEQGSDSIKSLDDLLNKIAEFKFANAPYVNVFDFSKMTGNLDKAKKGIDNLIDAMSKLQNGTALTKQELTKLALEYPKLLEASNLFTDGSIEGQKNMLNAILEMQEQEYDAQIDKKIAELEATEQVLQDQLDLEAQKAELIQEIKNIETNGVLGQEAELVSKISELNDLQGKNYVKMQDGVLSVNQQALTNKLEQESDFGKQSQEKIWQPFGEMVKGAHVDAFSKGLTALNSYTDKINSWMGNSAAPAWSRYGTLVANALAGTPTSVFPHLTKADTKVSAGRVNVTFGGNKVKVDDAPLDEWRSQQEKASKERIEKTQELLQKILNAKNNLIALKGLDLADIYGNSGSNKGSGKGDGGSGNKDKDAKEIDEYIAEIERYNKALQKLKDVEQEQAELERELENADNAFEKVDVQKNLIEVYKERQQALHELNNLRDTTIKNTIPELQALGFEIEYNADTNRLYIANLEHLNDLQADSAGEYETVQEATNALRKETEELIDDITELNEENQDSSKTWLDLADLITKGKDKVIEFLNEAVTEAVDFVGAMQDVYSTLKDAAKEYSESGTMSVDTLKKIAEYGAEYMNYLKDENGMLSINKERIEAVIAARTKQLAIDTAMSYVEKIRYALSENNIKELDRLITATEKASDATWDLVYSNLALLNLDESQYTQALENINRLKSLANNAVESIKYGTDESNKGYEDMQDALDKILDLTMDLVKYEVNQQIEALEEQKKNYSEIIDLKKKALDETKKENDYNKEVAEKVSKIAKLQSRINQLSLDDSREANAEKKSLEEELSELQTDLADYQSDYSIDKQKEMLDDMADAYDEEKDKEIKKLEESISSTEKIYRLAIDRINNNWDTLYDKIINWNYEAGSSIQSEIVSAWELASKAVQEYGSYLEAVNKIAASESADNIIVSDSGNYGDPEAIKNQMRSNSLAWYTADKNTQEVLAKQNADYAAQLSKIYDSDIDYNSGTWYKNGKALYSIDSEEAIKSIVAKMKENSLKWISASGSERESLSNDNARMAGYIEWLSNQSITKDANGIWWMGAEKLYEKYHTGGVVGDSTLKKDEVMAILKDGELVLDKKREEGLYKLVDFAQILSERLGTTIDTSKFDNLFGGFSLLPASKELLPATQAGSGFVEFSPNIEVNISHNGSMSDSDARRYGGIIAESALSELKDAFTKKGITNIGNSALK